MSLDVRLSTLVTAAPFTPVFRQLLKLRSTPHLPEPLEVVAGLDFFSLLPPFQCDNLTVGHFSSAEA